MNAGFKLADGGRVDVESVKETRRVLVEYITSTGGQLKFTATLSETRAISSALMGAAAEV